MAQNHQRDACLPPSYSLDKDRVCLHPINSLRITAPILVLESIYRISLGASLYFEKSHGATNSAVVFVSFGLLQGAFAIWALYISSFLHRRRLIINLFTAAFVGLSGLLMIIIILDIRTIRIQDLKRIIECATNPVITGIGYTIRDARARCEQRNTGIKLTAVLLEGIRFIFQLILFAVIYEFREHMLSTIEGQVSVERLENTGVSSSHRMEVLGPRGSSAPAYTPPSQATGSDNTEYVMALGRISDPSPPYQQSQGVSKG